jgi:hypothetical protein
MRVADQVAGAFQKVEHAEGRGAAVGVFGRCNDAYVHHRVLENIGAPVFNALHAAHPGIVAYGERRLTAEVVASRSPKQRLSGLLGLPGTDHPGSVFIDVDSDSDSATLLTHAIHAIHAIHAPPTSRSSDSRTRFTRFTLLTHAIHSPSR